MGTRVKAGDQLSHERTFTVDDVRAFVQVSGDAGRHHVEPDAQGRVIVQGLLTATLMTKLGGDLDYLAREMQFTFLRPVFTGDTIRCTLTIAQAVEEPGRLRV